MRITVKLFAILKDRAGVSSLDLELPEGSTIADAAQALISRFSDFQGLLARVAYAVNREYVPQQTTLKEGDELALIPPVSGG